MRAAIHADLVLWLVGEGMDLDLPVQIRSVDRWAAGSGQGIARRMELARRIGLMRQINVLECEDHAGKD